MPAGLLLSPTDRAERPGDGALAASLPPAAGSLASPAGTTSGPFGESPVGAVPFSVTRRPSSGLRLRRFPPYRPQSRLPPAPSPARWLGQKHGHSPPIPARVPLWLPSPARGDTHTSCPLSREYRSRRLPATCSSLSQPHTPFCFPLPGPSSHQCVRPAPSRPEDCALNQHFSSHPGTFVQRKMIL